MNNSTCCFLGHSVIEVSDKLKYKLFTVIEELIKGENIDTFLFGSKSQFDALMNTHWTTETAESK